MHASSTSRGPAGTLTLLVLGAALGLPSCRSSAPPAADWRAAAEQDWAAGRVRRTLRTFDEVGPLAPDDVDGAVFQATVYQEVGRFEKSLEVLRRIDFREPQPRRAYELRLNALRVLGRPAAAETLLDVLLWSEPHDARWLYERGAVRAERGDVAGARFDFQRSREQAADWWMPYVAEAAVLLGTSNAALVAAAQALLVACPPGEGCQPALDFHRALCAEALGNDGAARATYRQLLQEHPDHAPARINLAILTQRQGDLRGARRLFQQVLDATPESQADRRESLSQRIQQLDEELASQDDTRTSRQEG